MFSVLGWYSHLVLFLNFLIVLILSVWLCFIDLVLDKHASPDDHTQSFYLAPEEWSEESHQSFACLFAVSWLCISICLNISQWIIPLYFSNYFFYLLATIITLLMFSTTCGMSDICSLLEMIKVFKRFLWCQSQQWHSAGSLYSLCS